MLAGPDLTPISFRDGLFSIQLSGKDLYVQTRSGLVALLDAETGATRWRSRVGKPYEVSQPLAFNSHTVFVVNSTFLYALDRDSGATRWQFDLPGGLSAAPVADEEQVGGPLAGDEGPRSLQTLSFALDRSLQDLGSEHGSVHEAASRGENVPEKPQPNCTHDKRFFRICNGINHRNTSIFGRLHRQR